MDGQSEFDDGPGEVNLVARVLYGIAVAELDLPHIVLTRSTDTGETTYSGPYDTGLEALAAAEAEWQVDREAGGRGDIRFQVAALYPAFEVTTDAAVQGPPEPAPYSEYRRPSVRVRKTSPGAPPVRRLVDWLRESIEVRRVRPCRQCSSARHRVILAPARSAVGRSHAPSSSPAPSPTSTTPDSREPGRR